MLQEVSFLVPRSLSNVVVLYCFEEFLSLHLSQ